ncbi:MAG: dihydrolipoyllysine-residue succinyltransferase [Sulfobacillus acidophilus]|uniref:Dihydrolipoyllysine-residue succinyltransferase component of 2-oxoglutarate dehydrogenase complex n=1 Tax=Sulfobacillus acidophilus TaxID=53633 RepID=A0A2T2WES5_9FIRM|nr:MAG: dihydrolipoyllysine-residue succinyltransferase [Sulfobacillus acidophilus]
MSELKVPELGESVVEATVGRWLKQAGEAVKSGEAVVELETDKVNLEVAAEENGVLTQIVAGEGASVAVGATLAVIDVTAAEPPPVSPSAPATPEPGVAQATGARATPEVRRLAREQGVDLAEIAGSGPRGRVLREDVVTAPAPVPSLPAQEHKATSIVAPTLARSDREERVPMSSRRQTIARRLVQAQHEAAMLTTFNEVDMTNILAVRARRRESFKEQFGVSLGFMSFFTKAVVGALKQFPRLNAEIKGTEMILKHYYDIGVAVSTEAGLVVPVLRDADRLTFAEIEGRVADLAQRARQNKLTLPELEGGTFTITNGGVFGSLLSTPILNAPQVAILGMHKIEERPVAVNGTVVIRPMMYLALSYDHRIVDGSEAVRFLVAVKGFIEDPEKLLLEG